MTRKLIALLVLSALVIGIFAGCSNSTGTAATTTAGTTAAATTAAATTAAATTAAPATTAATTKATVAGTTATSVAATTAPAKTNLDFVYLDWYLVLGPPTMPDTEKVWAALNDYFKEKINCEVNIHLMDYDEIKTKGSTMIAAGQPFDVCYTGQGVPYLENAARNAFVALDDLLPEYAPLTLAQIPEYAWTAVRVNGKIYAIPAYKDLAQRINFIYNETLMNDLGLNIDDYHYTTDRDLIPLMYAANDAFDAKYPEKADQPIIKQWMANRQQAYFIDTILDPLFVDMPEIDMIAAYDDKTVFDWYETDEAMDFYKTIKQLVDDGVLPYDRGNFDKDNAIRNAGDLLGTVGAGSITVQKDYFSKDFDANMIASDIAYTYTAKITGNGQAISVTSPNPERALMMLELVNNDTFVATTLRFGLEGEHHITLPNGQVTFKGTKNEDATNRAYYYWYGAQIGSIFPMQAPDIVPENFFDLMDEINKTAYASSTMGFSFDTTPVSTEVATVSSTLSEFTGDLNNGMSDDAEALLQEFIDALKAAGIDKVKAEAQKQLDAFFAAK